MKKLYSDGSVPGIDFHHYVSKHFISEVEENKRSLPVKLEVDTKAKEIKNNEEHRPHTVHRAHTVLSISNNLGSRITAAIWRTYSGITHNTHIMNQSTNPW